MTQFQAVLSYAFQPLHFLLSIWHAISFHLGKVKGPFLFLFLSTTFENEFLYYLILNSLKTKYFCT